MKVEPINQFHRTRTGHLVFGLVELGLSYLFLSLAINSGSLWEWGLAIILFIGFLQNAVKLVVTSISKKGRIGV